MRVFIAGATGVLGRRVVPRLVAAGHAVVGLSRSRTRAEALRALGAVPAAADALDAGALSDAVRAARPDMVLHLLTDIPRSALRRVSDLGRTNALRTVGTRNLLDAAIAAGARRIVAESVIFAYGYGDLGGGPLTEDDPLPEGRWGRELAQVVDAARALERQVVEASDAGRIEGIVLRLGLLYGPEASELLAAMLRRRTLPLAGGGRGIGSWIHEDDAADAIMAALLRGRPGEVYNAVDDAPVTHREFFTEMANAVGAPRPMSIPLLPLRLVAPYAAAFFGTRLLVSNAKARVELGWAPHYRTWREGMMTLRDA